MKKKRIPFTQLEIDIIIKNLKLYPDNKSESFRQSVIEINKYYNSNRRTLYVIRYKYQTDLSKRYFITTVGSEIGFTRNIKNNPVKKGETFKREQPLQPIIVVMQQMISLSVEDRNTIINFFKSIK